MENRTKVLRPIMISALCATLASTAYAQETDLGARVKVLEATLQAIQAQREAQDKQIQLLRDALTAINHKVSTPSAASIPNASKAHGNPVYADFKNGIHLNDETGNWDLAVNGFVQADIRGFNPDESSADTYSLRRVRLGGMIHYYDAFSARIEGEYSNTNASLTFAYVDFNKYQQAKVRLGQFRVPYGLERRTVALFTDFQERSLPDTLISNVWYKGLMVHGAPTPGVYYSVSHVNGNAGDDTDAKDDGKDTVGRLTANIATLAGLKDSVIHLGGFYSKGHQEAGSEIPLVRTEGHGYKLFETTGTVDNTFTDSVDRTRSGLELALSKGSVKLQSEYIKASFDGDGFNRDIASWYASIHWLATGESFADFYKDDFFGRISPNNNFNLDGGGWGALQLGLRYSHFDGSDFVMTNPAGTGQLAANKTNKADAWTLGANWILNPNVRLVANYVRTEFDTPVINYARVFDHEDAFTMRAQFDF